MSFGGRDSELSGAATGFRTAFDDLDSPAAPPGHKTHPAALLFLTDSASSMRQPHNTFSDLASVFEGPVGARGRRHGGLIRAAHPRPGA